MKTLSVIRKKKISGGSRPAAPVAISIRYAIGADAPQLSEQAKQQLSHKRPSKRAAHLASIAVKANVRCTELV